MPDRLERSLAWLVKRWASFGERPPGDPHTPLIFAIADEERDKAMFPTAGIPSFSTHRRLEFAMAHGKHAHDTLGGYMAQAENDLIDGMSTIAELVEVVAHHARSDAIDAAWLRGAALAARDGWRAYHPEDSAGAEDFDRFRPMRELVRAGSRCPSPGSPDGSHDIHWFEARDGLFGQCAICGAPVDPRDAPGAEPEHLRSRIEELENERSEAIAALEDVKRDYDGIEEDLRRTSSALHAERARREGTDAAELGMSEERRAAVAAVLTAANTQDQGAQRGWGFEGWICDLARYLGRAAAIATWDGTLPARAGDLEPELMRLGAGALRAIEWCHRLVRNADEAVEGGSFVSPEARELAERVKRDLGPGPGRDQGE